MIKRLHAIAGLLALVTIAAFWLSTVAVELFVSIPLRPRPLAVLPPATSCTLRFPVPPLLSVSLKESPSTLADTLIAVLALIASITSSSLLTMRVACAA